MTPQELIDMPGHGNASAQVKKDGNWDEDKGKPYTKWTVDVTGYMCVKARSENDACKIADEFFGDKIMEIATDNARELK